MSNFVGAIVVSSLISIILHKWKITHFLIGEKIKILRFGDKEYKMNFLFGRIQSNE